MREYLSKEETNALRGVAALMVVAAHYVQRINQLSLPVTIPLIEKLGRYGVAVFFLCSAYGLMESTLRSENVDGKIFWRKRLRSVFVPYWLLQALSLLVLPMERKILAWEVLIEFTGIKHWYIFVCFFLYLLFYLSAKYQKKHILICCLVGISILNLLLMAVGRVPDYWYSSNYAFLVGLIVSKYKETILEHICWKSLACAIVLFLISSVLYAKFSHIWVVYFIFKNLSAIFWAVVVVLAIWYVPLKHMWLQTLGNSSIFLYVIHLNIFNAMEYFQMESLIALSAGVCLSVIISCFLAYVYRVACRGIQKHL